MKVLKLKVQNENFADVANFARDNPALRHAIRPNPVGPEMTASAFRGAESCAAGKRSINRKWYFRFTKMPIAFYAKFPHVPADRPACGCDAGSGRVQRRAGRAGASRSPPRQPARPGLRSEHPRMTPPPVPARLTAVWRPPPPCGALTAVWRPPPHCGAADGGLETASPLRRGRGVEKRRPI